MKNCAVRLSILILTSYVSFSAYASKLSWMLPNERNTIEVFQKTSPKVVYVHRMTTVQTRAHQPSKAERVRASFGIIRAMW